MLGSQVRSTFKFTKQVSICDCPQEPTGEWKLLCSPRGVQSTAQESEQAVFAKLSKRTQRVGKSDSLQSLGVGAWPGQ